MAVIRIIDLPENSKSLIDELRARGFTIATGSEDQSQSSDLELSLEECSIEEALEKCALTGDAAATIFIAPGAVDDSWHPIVAVPLIPDSSPDYQNAADAHPVEPEQIAPPVPVSVESAPAVTVELIPAATHADVLEPEYQMLQTAAEPDVREQLEVPSPDQRELLEQAVPVEAAPVEVPAGVLQSSIEPEEAKPATLEAAPDLAGTPSDWPIWNPLSEPVFAMEAVNDDQQKKSATASTIRPGTGLWASLRWDEQLFWKAAPVAAAVALLTFFAMTLAHRVSPLPPSISQGEEQTQQPPLARPHDDHARFRKVSAESALVPDPLDARPGSTSASEVVSSASKRQRIRSNTSGSTRNGTDFVARDTVVRYPAKKAIPEPARKTTETSVNRSGIRYYSDLPKAPR